MTSRRVVQLANFPLREIVTGGQIRVDRLARLIDRLDGDRRQLCITPRRDDGGADDIALETEADRWVLADPDDFELRLVDAMRRDPVLRHRLATRLRVLAPDVVWCEQPFLWPLVAPLAEDRAITVVYSGHNVEWRARRELLGRLGRTAPAIIERVATVERALIARADLVIACCEADAAGYRAMGANAVAIVPNGADPPVAADDSDAATLARLRPRLDPGRPVLAFIGADYQPNWIGLRDLVVTAMAPGGPLAGFQLVIMGEVSRRYEEWRRQTGRGMPDIHALGRVDEATRSAAFRLADVVILPLTAGGGTNLKTAEALLGQSEVVGTPIAFRGHEDRIGAPGVHCVAPDAFAARLAALDLSDREAIRARAAARRPQVSACRWDAVLAAATAEPLIKAVLRVGR